MGTAATRAIPAGGSLGDITTTTLKGADYGFGVIAYHTNTVDWAGPSNAVIPNFMWNQQVTWNTNYWTYSPVKFWPNDFAQDAAVDHAEGTGESGKAAWGSQNGGKVSFFAYAPYVQFTTTSKEYQGKSKASTEATAATKGITGITANDATGEPEVYYILGTADVDHAVDLLWGVRGNSSGYQKADGSKDTHTDYNTNLTKQSVTENVNFLFKHALSKVAGHTPESTPAGALQTGLQVVLDIDDGSTSTGEQAATAITGGTKQLNTLVTVKSIEIYDQASANTAGINNLSKATSDLVTGGWFNIANGSWTLGSTPSVGATYSSTVGTGESSDAGTLNANIAEPSDVTKLKYDATTYTTYHWANNTTEFSGVTKDPQDVYTSDSDVPSLILIPSTTAQTLVVRVKYYVRTYDTNLSTSAPGTTGETGQWTKVEQTITNEVTIPANSLQPNKYYKLLIHLGLTSVKFSASVVDWEEAAESKTDGTDNTDGNNDKDIYLPSNTLYSASTVPQQETVTSVSVAAAAGTSKTYSVPATAGDITIEVTGLKNDVAPTVVRTGVATAASATTAASNKSTVTVTLPANNSTAETQTSTVTISGKKSDESDFSMAVTLVQVQKTE